MAELLFTADAQQDLVELYQYIAENDHPEKADYVLQQLEVVVLSLTELPERGVTVMELAALGITDYREVFFKSYRIIYRVIAVKVIIYLIVDGRRNMQSVLQRRLLGSKR